MLLPYNQREIRSTRRAFSSISDENANWQPVAHSCRNHLKREIVGYLVPVTPSRFQHTARASNAITTAAFNRESKTKRFVQQQYHTKYSNIPKSILYAQGIMTRRSCTLMSSRVRKYLTCMVVIDDLLLVYVCANPVHPLLEFRPFPHVVSSIPLMFCLLVLFGRSA